MEKITGKINQHIEDIFILLEKKERDYSDYQLNNQQYVLLTLIIRHGEMTPSELAEEMSITKSAVSQQLAKLEAQSYIRREQDEQDKRAVTIRLGEKGLKYATEMDGFLEEISQKYEEHLSREEIETVLNSLEKLKTIIESL